MNKQYTCKAVLTLLSIILLPIITPAQIAYAKLKTATESISYDYFFKHVRYLASDELKGRGIGTPEYDLAADYLAKEFRQNGLLPYGDSGTYFQKILLLKSSIKKGSFSLHIKSGSKIITAEYGEEISAVLNPNSKQINESQEIIFVGYGNVVSEKNIDDYAGVNVVGKTVIVALGGPKGVEHPDFANRNTKFQNAVTNGATGLILFYPRAGLLQNIIFNKVHGFLSKSMLSVADSSIESFVGIDALKLLLFSKKKFVKKIFNQNGLNLRKTLRQMANGQAMSQALKISIHCNYTLDNDRLMSKNVVALLPGSDSKLKKEFLVIGAHLDHLGIGKPVKGDSIYNGMLDNATGVSALLSISKTFNTSGIRPKRSVLFVGYTAEENGLLGSNYFASKNHIKNGKIIANINIDMLAQTIETTDMAPLGYSHSNLSESVDFAAKMLNITINNYQKEETAYIERSDQISFIKKGVPALFMAGGFTTHDSKKDGEKAFNKWMKRRYHSPFDDLDQPYSEAAFLTALRFDFLAAYYIADQLKKISWDEVSWLYKKYVQEPN